MLSPTGSPGEETRQVRPAKVISRGGCGMRSSSLFMGYREGLKLRLVWFVTEGSESHTKEGGALEVTQLISNLSHQFLSKLRSKDFGCY